MNNPFVSISITTYNHQKFIEKCIKSVLEQNVNFKYEILIGNDASTDTTLQICEKIQSEYPEIIRIINHPKNIGLRKNNHAVWTNCQGKYIAYLEGDDYWTDPNKLQLLVDFLEENIEYSAAYHQVELSYPNKTLNKFMPSSNIEKNLTFEENLKHWEVGTCSFVYRNFINNNDPISTFFKSDIIFFSDRPLMAFASLYGPFKYLPKCMGVWRQHDNNMTKIGNLSKMNEDGAIAYKKMMKHFPDKKIPLSEQLIRWYMLAAEVEFRNQKFFKTLKFQFSALLSIRSYLGLKEFIVTSFQIIIRKKIYQ